jgi:magnesium transporter
MIENILSLMNENPINPGKLHELAAKTNMVDIADAFEFLSAERTVQVFRFLPKDIAADIFSYIVHEKQQVIVEALTDVEVGKIIDELFSDDAVDFIEEMPANVVKRVLRAAGEDTRQIINQLLQYPEDSAGSIMTTEFIDLKEGATVEEAFTKIREIGVDKETIYTCFVVRYDRVLLGTVSAKTLLLANPQNRIGDIMDASPIYAHTTADREEVAALFKKYSLLSLPIVDKEGRLVGLVTVDDVVQIIEEEATEDIQIMGALNPSEEPYLKTGVFRQSRNRIVWLMFLMLSAILTEAVINNFEETITQVVVLVAFIPMLMDTAGNAGAQASTLIIRGVALGEISSKNILVIVWRELRIALLCGAALSTVNFIRILITNNRDHLLGFVVSISIIATIIIAKTVGCTLPLIAKKFRIDPAIMAAPLITTIADVSSLIIYFSIAKAIMGI